MPFAWASGDDLDAFTTALDADPTVADVRTIDRLADASQHMIEWDDDVERKIDAMIDRHAIILNAVAESGEWFLRLRFAEDDHLSTFREYFRDDFRLHRKYRTTELGRNEFGLTPEQYEALVVAAQLGYFSVPRAATVEDIAARLDVSPNSVSERLRRAHHSLIQNTLLAPGEPHDG